MKSIIIITTTISLLAYHFHAVGQKQNIDNNTYKTWPALSRYGISNNGKYVWYSYNTAKDGSSLVFVSTDHKYNINIPKVDEAVFTIDNKYLIFKSDSGIGILNIAKRAVDSLKNGYNPIVPKAGDGKWLAYKKKGNIFLRDIDAGGEYTYTDGVNAVFNPAGTALLVNSKSEIHLTNLLTGKTKKIFSGNNIRKCCFGNNGSIAFIADAGSKGEIGIYHYDKKNDSVSLIIDESLTISGVTSIITEEKLEFSKHDKFLFFNFKEKPKEESLKSDIITQKLHIWSYKDKYLQSHQRGSMLFYSLRSFTAAINLYNKAIIQLEDKDIELVRNDNNEKYIMASTIANTFESGVNNILSSDYQIISLQNGTRRSFMTSVTNVSNVRLSPLERFISWVDTANQAIFCYEISSGKTRCLTEDTNILKENISPERRIKETLQLVGWMPQDEALIFYDRYDIWKVDPLGKKATCLTSSYGRKNKIILRLAEHSNRLKNLDSKDKFLVAGLIDSSNYNGIFNIQMSGKQPPTPILIPQPCVYYFPSVFVPDPPKPIKALNANVYIFSTQSPNYAPNLVLLRENNTLDTLSNIHPERDYNWLTSELHHWQLDNGEIRSGILFKPENFTPQQKYPIIFHYYQMNSRGCYMFRDPGLSSGGINIPWFVSNGYLVFIPDIWEQTGNSGYSALLSVESAARYLTRTYKWVDANKMGLQGHSYGGFETNYIIANSNLFAAAQSSSGLSDLISAYGDLGFGGQSLAGMCELWHLNMGGPQWEKMDLYIKNSPVLSANKINTPLLLMHNENDDAVPFKQSLELFISLRRLKKPVWLLQYEGGDHVLGILDYMKDFTLRQQQFFNHYLMDSLPPIWMTEGVSYSSREKNSGLKIDTSNIKSRLPAGQMHIQSKY